MQAAPLQEVFYLNEGPVVLTFPAVLSVVSCKDLSDHLELILRKTKRRVATKTPMVK